MHTMYFERRDWASGAYLLEILFFGGLRQDSVHSLQSEAKATHRIDSMIVSTSINIYPAKDTIGIRTRNEIERVII
jgi:hypothetical protein